MSETFAFLGTGSMGGAILDGLRAADKDAIVRATTRSSSANRPGVESRSTESDPGANRWAVEGASLVIVGVKPAGVIELLEDIADALHPEALIVSVAAGITTETMESVVPNPVVRSMPNTPALVGKGVTGIAAGSRATADHLARARAVFELVGWVLELPEDRINALSTISGSVPPMCSMRWNSGLPQRANWDSVMTMLVISSRRLSPEQRNCLRCRMSDQRNCDVGSLVRTARPSARLPFSTTHTSPRFIALQPTPRLHAPRNLPANSVDDSHET